MELCEVDEIVGEGSGLMARLVAAAREGHLCVEGGEVDCEVEELGGEEKWFGKKVGDMRCIIFGLRG